MTDQAEVTYVAQVVLSLPGQDEAATITVTLAPMDRIPAGGRVKPLAECTLAELRAFANTLEAEVWKTYDAITLLQLRDDASVDVDINILEPAAGEAEPDWLKQAIVFASEPDEAAPVEAAAPAESQAPETEAAAEATDAAEPASAAPAVEPEIEVKGLAVAAEQAAHAAPAQQKPAPAATEEPAAPPTVVPSRARVRVAGHRLPLSMAGNAAVDILLDEAPLRAMQAHALSSLDREVAGVMVGTRPEKQPDGRYVVHVIDSIAAKYTVMHGASVTYTPESWRYLNDTLWERYPDDTGVMVGWYHTHPGFGIFLSGMDLFIHENFFTQVWHVAYVLDPRARTSGFFCWNRQKTKVGRYDFPWPDWASGAW